MARVSNFEVAKRSLIQDKSERNYPRYCDSYHCWNNNCDNFSSTYLLAIALKNGCQGALANDAPHDWEAEAGAADLGSLASDRAATVPDEPVPERQWAQGRDHAALRPPP